MTDSLAYESVEEIAGRLRRRDLSSVEITQAMLNRIGRVDGELHSYVHVTGEAALAAAARADHELAQGYDRGALHGIPIALKDNIATADAPTSVGSRILAEFVPRQDAAVVRRLRAAGAVLLGKLALTEGAFAEHRPDLPAPVNPWHTAYWSGASSSGSAVATAAGLCYAALGTDTGGSIRLPAAACGVTALKPTWGCLSADGVFPLSASADHVGPLARSVEDVGLVFAALTGGEPPAGTALRGLTLGIDPSLERLLEPAVARSLADAITVLQRLGLRVKPIDIAGVLANIPDTSALYLQELSQAHRASFPARAPDYGPALRRVLEAAMTVSADAARQAGDAVRQVRGRAGAWFSEVNLVLLPTMSMTLRPVDEAQRLAEAPEAGVTSLTGMTWPFNLTGHPALALPAGRCDAGLPVGVQLIADLNCEAVLLLAGLAFQGATDWHRRHPAAFP